MLTPGAAGGMAAFSKMLDAVETSEAKFLFPETPAGAREVLQTFLTRRA
jgi:hypothetical protein